MGATPSQHLSSGVPENVHWPLQDDMGVVLALPSPPPLRSNMNAKENGSVSRSGRDYLGRRVFSIQPGSPAASCGLVPWLDYIVGIEGQLFGEEDAEAPLTRGMEAGRKTKLRVYNIKTGSVRDCSIVPTVVNNQLFIGLRISLLHVPDVEGLDKVVRVTGVAEGSPAAEAGLEPEHDYMLGTVEFGAFATLDDVEFALTSKEDTILQDVFVYNSIRDDVRAVSIRPRIGWSEDGGILGAELANGILHQIPHVNRRTCGKDMITAGEANVEANERVMTPEGMGEIVERLPDGASVVRLDWGLGRDVSVTGIFIHRNIESVGG